jgi:hypothetical protein
MHSTAVYVLLHLVGADRALLDDAFTSSRFTGELNPNMSISVHGFHYISPLYRYLGMPLPWNGVSPITTIKGAEEAYEQKHHLKHAIEDKDFMNPATSEEGEPSQRRVMPRINPVPSRPVDHRGARGRAARRTPSAPEACELQPYELLELALHQGPSEPPSLDGALWRPAML